jgi:transposase
MTTKQSKADKKNLKLRYRKSLEMINPDTSGIDIGSEEIWVSVPEDRTEKNVLRFRAYTCDLHEIAKWLKKNRITSVAMESTGVYWIPLFEILEQKGFDVFLVNAREVKNVSGRPKTDNHDCQWIRRLQTYGLLRNSFRPSDEVCRLRTLARHRKNLNRQSSRHIQHMQKALHLMNLLLPKVVSDITGKTGMAIINAILKGERDPYKLAMLRDSRIKSTKNEIAKALTGNYRREELFILKQAVEAYNYVLRQMSECSLQIQKQLDTMSSMMNKNASSEGDATESSPEYDVKVIREHLISLNGIDVTKILGIEVETALTLISEVGYDMFKWKDHKYFTSWLGLSPNNKVSGGKVLKTGTRKVQSRAAAALRMSASTLRNSKCYLGAYYRKMSFRKGPAKALTATARKLAIIYYNMVKYKKEYTDLGADYYQKRYKDRYIKNMKKSAGELGFILVPVEKAAEL